MHFASSPADRSQVSVRRRISTSLLLMKVEMSVRFLELPTDWALNVPTSRRVESISSGVESGTTIKFCRLQKFDVGGFWRGNGTVVAADAGGANREAASVTV